MKDIWTFLLERKKYWLMPIFLVLLLLAILVAISSHAAFAPFIYTIF